LRRDEVVIVQTVAESTMQVYDPTTEDAVLLSIAESELFGRRYALGLGTRIPESLNERLRYAPLAEWSPADREALVNAIRAMHLPLVAPLLRLDLTWFDAALDATDLPDLRTPESPEFRQLAPDQRLGTLVTELRWGKDTPDGEFSGAFRHLRREFRPALLRGRPCLVAPTKEGPFTVLEGLTRLAVILALAQAGRPSPDPVPAYVGISERLPEWGFEGDMPAAGASGGGLAGTGARNGPI